jgi:hypothetical protein
MRRAADRPRFRVAKRDESAAYRIPSKFQDGVIRELCDVAFLPGMRRPSAIGFKTGEVNRTISIEG